MKRSGRVPINLMEYLPTGFNIETNIDPELGSTFIKSDEVASVCPSELSKPE